MTSPRAPVLARLAGHWPLWTMLLIAGHGGLQLFLQARPGRAAIVPYLVGPSVLLGLTAVVITMALYDILHSGWRKLLRGSIVFNTLALGASMFLSMFTYRVYPSSYDDRPAAGCYALPLEGDVAVMHGGRTIDTNYHAAAPSQRYAYDLAIARSAATYAGEGLIAEDHHVYGRPVLAPVPGTVVSVVDGHSDQSMVTSGWLVPRSPHGNFVVVQAAEGQYLFLTHLQAGSIEVVAGDPIRAGAQIARVGNSGHPGAPHLHMHLQDSPEANTGEGIPVEFCGYEEIAWGASWSTARHVERGMPTGRRQPQVIRVGTVR